MNAPGEPDDDSPDIPQEINVVILRDAGYEHPITINGSEVDLASAAELPVALLNDLQESAVRFVLPYDISPAAFDEVHDLSVPQRFDDSGWLRDHRPLVLDHNGRRSLGGITFEYHPVYGLRALGGPEEES